MNDVTVRAYRADDETRLIELWNAALPLDSIDPPTFRRKVLLDPNFCPDWLLIAEVGDQPIGFCLCLIRRVALETSDLDPDRGWITAMGVHPEWRCRGAGSSLLKAALQLFGGKGRKQVSIAPYVPNYFVPGVDVQHYGDGVSFLTNRGFEEIDRPMSMDANIVRLDTSPFLQRESGLGEQGIEIRTMAPHEIPLLMHLLQTHMPPDWVSHARQVLIDIGKGLADWDQFTIALHRGAAVGYCQFEDEHFGPFGVVDEWQGKGIGTVLLAKCLRSMQRRGLHNAWVLWTGDQNADRVYGRFGFRETRRFAVLRREL